MRFDRFLPGSWNARYCSRLLLVVVLLGTAHGQAAAQARATSTSAFHPTGSTVGTDSTHQETQASLSNPGLVLHCDELANQGKYSEAFACLGSFPEKDDRMRSRAAILANMGLTTASLRTLERHQRAMGAEMQPNDRSHIALIASFDLMQQGDSAGALALLDKADAENEKVTLGSQVDSNPLLRLITLPVLSWAKNHQRASEMMVRLQVLERMGRYDEGVKARKDFGKPFLLLPSFTALLDVMTARVLYGAGRKDEARDLLTRQLPRMRKSQYAQTQAEAEWVLGEIYYDQGADALALEHFDAARAASLKTDSNMVRLLVFPAELQMLLNQKQYDQALAALDRTRQELAQNPDLARMMAVNLTSWQAMVYAGAARWADIVPLVDRFVASDGWDHPGDAQLSTLTYGLQAALQTGDKSRAAGWAGNIRSWLGHNSCMDLTRARADEHLARHALTLGHKADAESLLKLALDDGDRVRMSALGSAVDRVKSNDWYAGLIDLLVQLQMERKAYRDAVASMERGRARVVQELMMGDKAVDLKFDEATRTKLRTLNGDISGIQQKIENLAVALREPVSDADAPTADKGAKVPRDIIEVPSMQSMRDELAEAQKALAVQVSARNSLLERVRVEHLGSSAGATDSYGVAELEKLPQKGEVIVTWHLTPDRAWVVALGPDKVVGAALKGNAASLQKQIEAFRSLLNIQAPGPSSEVKAQASQLYHDLFDPVRAMVESTRSLIVLPHGPLHYLPFSALVMPDGSWLGQQRWVSNAPSATILGILRNHPVQAPRLQPALIVGDSKPGTPIEIPNAVEEAKAVVGIINGTQTKILLDKEATESRVKEELKTAHTVLFSTHGAFIADAPQSSYLSLEPGSPEDGRLTAEEIQHLPMQADLVMLSGCRTGEAAPADTRQRSARMNQHSSGDDVLGLSVAFQAAGASEVVGTLWSVADESSSLFVTTFFKAVHDGQTSSAALQTSRARLIDHPMILDAKLNIDTSHPAYWASYFIVGPALPPLAGPAQGIAGKRH